MAKAKKLQERYKEKSDFEIWLTKSNPLMILGGVFLILFLISFLFTGLQKGIFDVGILLIISILITFGLRKNYREFRGSFIILGIIFGFTIYKQGGYFIVWLESVSIVSFLITLFTKRKGKTNEKI